MARERWCCINALLLLMSFFSLPLASQDYFFEHYGVEEGLSSSKVYSLLQDNNENIWLGTESGVSLFDGSRFTTFYPDDGVAPGGVYSLFQDTAGGIWMGHLNGGLSYFRDNRFMRFRIDSVQISSTSDITSIIQRGNYIWLTTSYDGAVRIPFPDMGDTTVIGKQYKGKEGLSDQVFCSYVDREGNLFCITGLFIKRYNPESDLFETFSPEGLTKYFSVIVMYEDSKGNYWFGTHNGGLYMKEKATGKMRVYDSQRDGLSRNMITSIIEDHEGNIWLGTWGGGITRLSPEGIKIFNKSDGLSSLYIHALLEDREKNIIIADHNEGMSIYKGDYLVTYKGEEILPDPDVWSVCQDDKGCYWFGTNSGITLFSPYDRSGHRIVHYNNENNNIGSLIRFMVNDGKGSMWIGTSGSGITRYDFSSGRFVYDLELNSLNNQRIVTAMTSDQQGLLWVGTHDGLVAWDKTKGEGNRYTQINGLCGNNITALYCDKEGTLWIGSEVKNGLTRHCQGTDEFEIVNLGEDIVPRAICQTSDGRLWIGTTSGIAVIRNGSIIQNLDEEDGLLSNNVKFLQSNGDQYLYIGTNQGLNRYNLTDGTIASFTRRNGYVGLESRDNASFADRDGRLWFGTANGVTMLDPEAAPAVNTSPDVHITSFNVNYRPVDMHEGMKLKHKEKTIEIIYNSVCLYNPESVRYRVMLEGADADWRPVTDQTNAFYSGLSPKHYTFRVKASNSDGYWTEIPESFSFTIKPPFWFTYWFIALCVIIITVLIIIYIKMREATLLREKVILENKVEERTAEVVQKSLEIEAKNKDITASIRYAERIQRAMLPRENLFAETFVLFMPKDIVSGDFYWMYDGGDRRYIAAVDCTGHGVPGAFMSIIGHNSLNKIVMEYGLKKPSEILNELHQEVVHALLQRTEKAIKDGMDISLIAYDTVEHVVEYAGAFHPLYHVREGEVTTIRADRFPIGFSEDGEPTDFRNNIIYVEKGDMLYMCSDGYADQFGGGDDKKFKTGRIKEILSKVYNKPVEEQKRRMEVAIRQWMGDCPQVDDILFIGTRIT